MKYITLFFIITLYSCNSAKENLTAQQIIDKTIIASGTNKIKNANVQFTFRGKNYEANRYQGKYELKRKFDSIEDILSNDGFVRLVKNNNTFIPDSIATKYANSVNSVHYFSVLPYGLNDKAVQKKRLPSEKIKGKDYYKIEVTFSKDGGGEDFEDVFIYWISKENFLIDFLAYSYHTNGGGKRFRVLKEQCNVKGIRFVDYYNYKPINKNIKLINIDKAFEDNQLKKVSEIVLKDIEVNPLD